MNESNNTDLSYQRVPSSFEDYEKEDNLYSEMCSDLTNYVAKKRATGLKIFVGLWLLWIIGVGQALRHPNSEISIMVVVIGAMLLSLKYWTYYRPLTQIEAILTFITEDLNSPQLDTMHFRRIFGSRFRYSSGVYSLFKLNVALNMLTIGYDSKLRTDGFKGFDPVVARLRIIAEDKKGKSKQPEPWVLPDGSVVINPQF